MSSDERRILALNNLLEESPRNELSIARRHDGLIYVAGFDMPPHSGVTLEEALDSLIDEQEKR